MRVAVLGPAHLEPLLPHLNAPARCSPLPQKQGATPVAPLAAGLLDRGHEVLVLTLSSEVEDELVLEGDRVRVRIGHYRPRHRARDGFAAERRYLASALRSEAYDVAHANWGYEYALAALEASRPTVITLRDWAPTVLRMLPDPYRFIRLMMNLRVLYSARHFTVTSPYMQRKLHRWTGRTAALIPNGLPQSAFKGRQRGPRLGAPELLAVNNGFQRRKNVTALLRSLPAILAWNPGCTLRLIGHGFGPNGQAKRWADSHGLSSSVKFCGPLPADRVADAMARADLFVHPALEESFGMVVAEAMAHGLPVVAGRDSGAIPWVLDNGNAGLLVDVKSPTDIAQNAIRILSHPELWHRFSAAGFRRVSSTFRLAAVLDEYEQAYSRAMTD